MIAATLAEPVSKKQRLNKTYSPTPEKRGKERHLDLLQKSLRMGGELVLTGLTKKQFYEFTAFFPELQMEREKNGDITITNMVHSGSGIRENRLNRRVGNWCETNLGGETFSPTSGFDLPDGAIKSPDVAWVSAEKMARLHPGQVENEFIPVVPDFIIELRSSSDRVAKLQKKMKDTWIANGVRLGWLIDPFEEKAHIYRLDGGIEIVSGFDKQLSGEDVLPGFTLDLAEFRVYGK